VSKQPFTPCTQKAQYNFKRTKVSILSNLIGKNYENFIETP